MKHEPLILRNPHSAMAALLNRPTQVKAIFTPDSKSLDKEWSEVIECAKKHKIPIQSSKAIKGQFLEGRVGSFGAQILVKESLPIETFFNQTQPSGNGVWLALDQLQDPQNVGAIFRTASYFGVRGIIMTQDRSAQMSGTVYDIASGGVESVPFCVSPNLVRALEIAKDSGLWTLGTSEHGKMGLGSVKLDRNWLIVVGNEEKGMRRLTSENCDQVVKIESQFTGALGQVTSLNVSVATALILGRFLG